MLAIEGIVNSNIQIEEIPYGSALYQQSLTLREDVLRLPLSLTLTPQDTEGEANQFHIVALNDTNVVVGTVLLKPVDMNVIKLRQMAVSNPLQNNGIGKQLVLYAERLACINGFKTIELHARVSAQRFYQSLGYIAHGDPFIEVILPHICMGKTLRHTTITNNKAILNSMIYTLGHNHNFGVNK
jgi:predicted GNAT family N-acyltransferase